MAESEKNQQGLEPQSARIVKAKANGFAQGGHVAPIKRTTTERWEASMEEELDLILKKMRRNWIDLLGSKNEKIRLDATHKLTGHLHRPDAKVTVEHTGDAGGDTYNILNVDTMSAADRAMFERARKASHVVAKSADVPDVIEAEVLSEDSD